MGSFGISVSESRVLCMLAHFFRKLVMATGSAKRRLQLIPTEYPPHWKFVTYKIHIEQIDQTAE